MTDDDLDRILSRDDSILPSSGFVSSVMDAVRREAAAPPAIPFPWKRALPGLVAWAVMLVLLVVPETASALDRLLKAPAAIGAGWVALAVLLSFFLVKLSLRLAGARE
jgi:uncharacterized membrane protein